MANQKIPFAHLHCHSQFSLLDGACRIERLVEKVKKSGMDSIAVTDHGVMSSLPKLQAAADKAGIKSILGIEAYLVEDRHVKKPRETRWHLTLLAENDIGYENLCHLTSLSFTEGFYNKPRMDYELLRKYNEGIIVLTGCMAGRTMRALAAGNKREAREEVERMMDIFGPEDVYLEIQNSGIKGQVQWNDDLAKIGKELGRPVVGTGDVHYLNDGDAQPHDTMLCVQTHTQVSDTNRMKMLPHKYWLKTPDEMTDALKQYPESLAVAQEIADRCNARIKFNQRLYPQADVPAGEDAASYLRKQVRVGLEEKLGDKLSDEYEERMEYELGVIEKSGYSDYFLIVQDFLDWARKKGIPTGPGRGSAAGSIIAYALDITSLDPIEYGLLFERFLNPERISPPDIDCDLGQIGRDDVINYCIDKYGHDRVSHIATFGTVGAKMGVRDSARALGLPYSEGDRIAKLIPDDIGISIDESLKVNPDLKKACSKDPMTQKVIDQARWMEGLARNAGIHASAILIAPEGLDNLLPMRITKSGPKKDIEVYNSQYDGVDVEKIGLLKMDFLGLRNLDIIAEAERLIKASTGDKIDVKSLPMDDEKTFEMLQRGDSVGVFQFESDGMQNALRLVGVDQFSDLVAIVSLYRPGPMANLPIYARNKKNPSAMKYIDPRLADELKSTYAIIIYQEQLMKMSQIMAGFSPSEADELRKIVGKKLIDKLPDLKKKFISGCLAHNTSKEVADQLWKQVESAGSYSFNLSHAACYSFISYQTAWLKANYPTQYMAAVLTSVINTKDKVSFYLYETRRMGIKVLPPNVNESYASFTVIGDKELRFGLEAIKHVGSKAIDRIVENREEEGEFKSIWDFARRVPEANKRCMEFLIKAGAFDSFQGSRKGMLDSIEDVVKISKKQRAQGEVTNTGTLFESVEDELAAHIGFEDPEVSTDKFPYQEMLHLEFEALKGVYASGHPVDEDSEAWEQTVTAKLGNINENLEGEQVTVVGVVVAKKVIYTRRGNNKMCFLTINDPTGTQEVVFFSSVLEVPGTEEILEEGSVIGITAKVAEDKHGGGKPDEVKSAAASLEDDSQEETKKRMKLLAQRAFAFEPKLIPKREVYTVNVTEEQFNENTVKLLKDVLKQYSGNSPVKLCMQKEDGTKKMYRLGDEFRVRINVELEEAVRGILAQDKTLTESVTEG